MSWPTHHLGGLVRNGELSYGIVQPGSEDPTGVPIVRVKDLRDGRIDQSAPLRVSPAISQRHGRTVLTGGELLVSIVGTVGEAAVAPASLAGWNVARAIAVVRPIEVSSQWVRLCLETPAVQEHLQSMLNTTVQATLNLADLKRLPIPVPPAFERRGIEGVLGALDDKIAANATLVTTAEGLLDALARQVLSSAEGSRPLDSLAQVTKGVSYRRSDLAEDSQRAMVTLKSITREGRYTAAGLKGFVGEARAAQYLSLGDLVVAQTDLTQAAEVVGRAVRVPASSQHKELIASLDLAIVRPRGHVPTEYLLGILRSNEFRQHCRDRTSGTTVLHLGRGAIETFDAPWVEPDVQVRFSERVRPLHELLDAKADESEALVRMRDALLPQLMSGKIRVRDAERVVEGVV